MVRSRNGLAIWIDSRVALAMRCSNASTYTVKSGSSGTGRELLLNSLCCLQVDFREHPIERHRRLQLGQWDLVVHGVGVDLVGRTEPDQKLPVTTGDAPEEATR